MRSKVWPPNLCSNLLKLIIECFYTNMLAEIIGKYKIGNYSVRFEKITESTSPRIAATRASKEETP